MPTRSLREIQRADVWNEKEITPKQSTVKKLPLKN
jgi:hypothetical protein